MRDTIYHMCPSEAWTGLPEDRQYYPPTYDKDGFIHCTGDLNKDLLLDIANHFYVGSKGDWIVLTVDVAKLGAEVKWEAPMPVGETDTMNHTDGDRAGASMIMPHVYGTIDREAATVTHRLVREENGTFVRIERVEI
jgi:uncharacterized protein (DUF952 family)